MDLQNIDQRVEEIRRLSIHEKSRKQYNSANTQFIIYLMSENPPLITTALQEKVVGKSTDEIKKIIGNDLQNRSPAPIVFEQLEPKYFIQWLLSLRKGNGEEPGIGLFKSHRSALKHLFEEFNAVQSPLFVKELKQLFKGLTKQKVRRIGQGHGKVKEGKDPLPFKMYTMMAKHLLHSVEKEFVFARCFLTVCWNLMCRAGNMSSVCYSHMDWCADALQIYFAHMKNDQCGENSKDPRHIYANPLQPEICPILSLGMYWLVFGFDSNPESKHLFPGSNQYERFRKQMQKLLKFQEMLDTIDVMGVKKNDFGTHSIRKGALTYCSGGSTCAPSATAICLRGGWSLPGVQGTYIKYEAAGDQFVGRTASGLPVQNAEFAVLPPEFTCSSAEIASYVKKYFPSIPHHLKEVGNFTLASVVYQSQFLIDELPPNHPIFSTQLFIDVEELETMRENVRCTVPGINVSDARVTGVPPHVATLCHIKALTRQIDCSTRMLSSEIEDCANDVLNGVIKELEDRAIGAGTVGN